MNLLLLGATGLVGRNVLAQALANPAVTRVIAPTRRPLKPHAKLTNPVSDRLETLLSEGINEGDRRSRLLSGHDDQKGRLERGVSQSGLRAPVAVCARRASAWSGQVCPYLSEHRFRHLSGVLFQNQRRSRARYRSSGLQITDYRATEPDRRSTRRAKIHRARSVATAAGSCANSAEEASYQSC